MTQKLSDTICNALLDGRGIRNVLSACIRERLVIVVVNGVCRISVQHGESLAVLVNEAILTGNPVDFEVVMWLVNDPTETAVVLLN